MKIKTRYLVTLCIIILICIAAILSWEALQELWKEEPEPIDTPVLELPPEPEGPPVIMDRFLDLYAQNNDLVGWIRVPGTNIDYPVVYCSDNAYYLEHDFQKNPSKEGVPFLDMSADLLVNNQSLSIYGHYYKNKMFGQLHNYKKLAFYKENPTFVFDSLYEEGTYKIFSVFYMAGNQSDGQFYYYPVSKFKDDEGFMEHVRELRVRSIFNTTVEVEPGDQIVMMTCCTYETKNLRLIVAGRKVRPGEESLVDAEGAVENPEPLYPQKWYDTRGGHPPEVQ